MFAAKSILVALTFHPKLGSADASEVQA